MHCDSMALVHMTGGEVSREGKKKGYKGRSSAVPTFVPQYCKGSSSPCSVGCFWAVSKTRARAHTCTHARARAHTHRQTAQVVVCAPMHTHSACIFSAFTNRGPNHPSAPPFSFPASSGDWGPDAEKGMDGGMQPSSLS